MGKDTDVNADNVLAADEFEPGASLVLSFESRRRQFESCPSRELNLLYSLADFLHLSKNFGIVGVAATA